MPDELQKLFNWAEDHHYLTTIKEMINAASKQVAEMETQITALQQGLRDAVEVVRVAADPRLRFLRLEAKISIKADAILPTLERLAVGLPGVKT